MTAARDINATSVRLCRIILTYWNRLRDTDSRRPGLLAGLVDTNRQEEHHRCQEEETYDKVLSAPRQIVAMIIPEHSDPITMPICIATELSAIPLSASPLTDDVVRERLARREYEGHGGPANGDQCHDVPKLCYFGGQSRRHEAGRRGASQRDDGKQPAAVNPIRDYS